MSTVMVYVKIKGKKTKVEKMILNGYDYVTV